MRRQSDRLDTDAAPRHEVHRLFFALWPGQALRQRIEEATLRMAAAHALRGRPMAPDRYHLTLQFLGDFEGPPRSVIEAAIAAAENVRSAAFELPLNHAGNFGGTKVGWLGPASMPAGLQRLWDGLGLALAKHGVTYKSAATFTPHVTVLRNTCRPMPATGIPPISWSVEDFVLIESHPSQLGPSAYTQLRRWPLHP